MINITFDTSCYEKKSFELFEKLKKLQDESLIKMWHEGLSVIETDRWTSVDKDKIMSLFHTHSDVKSNAYFVPIELADNPEISLKYAEKQLGYRVKELGEIHSKIDSIKHPEGFGGKTGLNKYIDGKLLALHIVRGRDFFVTKDERGFIKYGKQEKLEKAFLNLKIRILDEEFVTELKLMLNKMTC